MTSTTDIREHMDVTCSCGANLGRVDRVEGNQIKLTKSGGKHHWIPIDWVDQVEDNQVMLNKNSEESRREWSSSAPTAAVAG